MNWVVGVEVLALLLSLGAFVRVLWSRSGPPLEAGILILLFLLGVQALVHLSDAIEWLGFLDMDRVGDDLRVLVPLLWLLAVFALHRASLSRQLDQERAQVEFFLEEAPIAAVVLTPSGVVLDASKEWARLSGTSRSELRGRNLTEAPGAPRELIEVVLERATRQDTSEQSEGPVEFEWGARKEWLEWRMRAQNASNAEEGRISLVVHVATAEVERELALRSEASKLAETHRVALVGQLASTVAHDLNNFLHVITANAELLPHSVRDSDEGDLRAAILEASALSAELVRSLTALGRARGRTESVDLVGLVRSTAALLERSMPANVRIRLDLPSAPSFVSGDRSRLQQAIVNLVMNARDAIGGAGVIRAGVVETAADIKLFVEDNGSGIAPENLSHIFDHFFTTKAEQNGTGLGLALVQAVSAEHQAVVEVDSTPNVGTTFTLRFPRAASGRIERAPARIERAS